MFPGALRTFYEVVRRGSVRKAGVALGLSPSSVSRQISQLEREIGAALFDRKANGLTLTYAGTQAAEYARNVIMGYDSLRADLDASRGIKTGMIRLATVEGSVSDNAVAAVSVFRQKYPGVRFQVRVLPATIVIEVVKRGEVDVGLTFCGRLDTQLRFESRTYDPIALVVPASHALAERGSIALEQLRHLPLALPEPAFNIRQVIDEASQRMGFALEPVLSSDSFSAIRAFVAAGSGFGVLTRMGVSAEERRGVLRAIPIEIEGYERTTVDVITLRSVAPSRLLKTFLATLGKAMGSSEPRPG